jgi:hypothetical protein
VARGLALAASSHSFCVVGQEGFPKGCITGLRSIRQRLPYIEASPDLRTGRIGARPLGQCNPKKAIGSGLIVGF